MSEELAQFLAEYLTWAGDTQNLAGGFKETHGLCAGACDWGFYFEVPDLEAELAAQLEKSRLDNHYPFDAGEGAYVNDCQKHLNPKRIIWTRRELLKHSLYSKTPNLAIPIFLRDWLKWAVTGEQPTGAEFVKESGLCHNLVLWTDPYEQHLEHEGVSTQHYYLRLGEWAGWCQWETPFNTEVPYGSEVDCTRNPARRAFALTHAKTLYTQTPDWMKNV